ncbi:MAG TPA: hypothetical protein VD860_00395 [Azospirillum sp.]|nr:hypothetical protein [Azospirillum sp.]
MARHIWNRLHNDYLRTDRRDDYRALLDLATGHGYRQMTVGAYAALRRGGVPAEDERRILIMRHDIDTAPRVARMFAEEEVRVGGRGSYFFRLQTADVRVMQDLADAGHEVGYHYEELATVAKERGVNGKDRVPEILGEARERFLQNLARLRARTGLPLRIAASHGDFANRALGVSNTLLLADRTVRERAGIDLEAYDPEVEQGLAFRTIDMTYPLDWRQGKDPAAAIRAGLGPMLVLTHPRQWGRQWYWNAREDLKRAAEGVLFSAGLPQMWRRA